MKLKTPSITALTFEKCSVRLFAAVTLAAAGAAYAQAPATGGSPAGAVGDGFGPSSTASAPQVRPGQATRKHKAQPPTKSKAGQGMPASSSGGMPPGSTGADTAPAPAEVPAGSGTGSTP